MSFQNLLVETRDGIATVTFNRPEIRNALTRETLGDLESALARIADDSAAGVVVFAGAGEKAFVSGADVRDLQTRTALDAVERRLSRLFETVEAFPKATVAAIQGYCLGGGLEFALACDIRIGAADAKLGFPETGIGIIPSAGGTQRAPRIAGFGAARYLVLTGDVVPADEAVRLGLLHRIAAPGRLADEAREIARKILARGPLATRLAKESIRMAAETPLSAGLRAESLFQAVCFQSEDKREGTTAFLEKRPPRFQGR
jgi:enoyl-CoA hydratase